MIPHLRLRVSSFFFVCVLCVCSAVALAKALRDQGAELVGVCTHASFKSEVVESSGGLFNSGASFYDIGPAPDDALRDTPEGAALTSADFFGKLGAAKRFMVWVFVYLFVSICLSERERVAAAAAGKRVPRDGVLQIRSD